MLFVHVHVTVKAESIDEFLAATMINAEMSIREPGVVRFDVVQDVADATHLVLVEVYQDARASAAHKQTQHYAVWRDAVASMMARPRASTKYSALFPATIEGWQS